MFDNTFDTYDGMLLNTPKKKKNKEMSKAEHYLQNAREISAEQQLLQDFEEQFAQAKQIRNVYDTTDFPSYKDDADYFRVMFGEPSVYEDVRLAQDQQALFNNVGTKYASNEYAGVQSDANYASGDNEIDYSKYGDDFKSEFIDKMLNDVNFQDVLKITRHTEGGYNNDLTDLGKETNHGISSRAYPNEDIKNLTSERANAIYYRDYWLKPKMNLLPKEYQYPVFDNGVNQGQWTAIKHLQKAAGVKEDGDIGSITLKALQDNNDYNAIISNFRNIVNKKYNDIIKSRPDQIKYKDGWNNRSNTY